MDVSEKRWSRAEPYVIGVGVPLAAGVGTAVLGSTWGTAVGVGVVALLICSTALLVKAGVWQAGELQRSAFLRARAADASDSDSETFMRERRGHIQSLHNDDSRAGPPKSVFRVEIELWRRYLEKTGLKSVNLMVIARGPGLYRLLTKAGSFDTDADHLAEGTLEQWKRVTGGRVSYRSVGIGETDVEVLWGTDSALDAFDEANLELLALNVHALLSAASMSAWLVDVVRVRRAA